MRFQSELKSQLGTYLRVSTRYLIYETGLRKQNIANDPSSSSMVQTVATICTILLLLPLRSEEVVGCEFALLPLEEGSEQPSTK